MDGIEENVCLSTPLDLEDIEDLIDNRKESNEVYPNERTKNRPNVVIPKVRKREKQKLSDGQTVNKEIKECDTDTFLPGTASVYVKTWGCAHNSSDGEYMAGQLAEQGYALTEKKQAADVWILNSCTVKNPAEDHFRNEVQKGLDEGKKVVVAGCVPQGKPDADYIRGLSVIGVQQIDRVVEVVEETLKGNQVRLFGQKKVQNLDDDDGSGQKLTRKGGGAPLSLPKVRRNPLIEIISINTGCLNQCTYCKTKHARGELGSYPIGDIVARAQQSFEEGVVEIWLTSEDTGAYGRDIGVTLPDLLWKLVEVIPEGCRLRLGMTNPPYILDHLEEMAKIMEHPRVYKFLHVPIQSGSDSVLAAMKREYDSDDFCRVVNILKQKVDGGITIATDIICGFPTETDEDFLDTFAICKKYKFPSLFINQFYPRPGTPAAKMKRVASNKEVKQRTKILTDYFYSYEPYKNNVGNIYEDVLVTDISHDKEYYVGHNEFYEQILLPKDDNIMGKLVNVKILKATKFSMIGEVINEDNIQRPTDIVPLKKGEVSGGSLQNGVSKRQKSPKESSDFMQNFMYKSSMIILLLAILVRVFQLIYYATIKKQTDIPETPLEGVTATQFTHGNSKSPQYM